MENLKNKALVGVASSLLAVALVVAGWATALLTRVTPVVVNVPDREVTLSGAGAEFYTVASSSAITVQTSSTLVTATSTARSYLAIVNDGSNVVYLNFDDKAAVANSGVRLNANGGTLELNSENLYKGAIRAIASGGTSVITFLEANGR